mgnify:FL=1
MVEVGDTPILGRQVCLQCEPDLDPTVEILDHVPCEAHALASQGYYSFTNSQGFSPDNNSWCDAIHRGRWGG